MRGEADDAAGQSRVREKHYRTRRLAGLTIGYGRHL